MVVFAREAPRDRGLHGRKVALTGGLGVFQQRPLHRLQDEWRISRDPARERGNLILEPLIGKDLGDNPDPPRILRIQDCSREKDLRRSVVAEPVGHEGDVLVRITKKRAPDEAMRRSQQRAISSPPPKQMPRMAAIVGFAAPFRASIATSTTWS